MAAKKPYRSRFKAHMYDLSFEWRLLAYLKRNETKQRQVMHNLLAECWAAGLLQEDIERIFDDYERLVGTYPISYLRGMLLKNVKEVNQKVEAAIW